MFSNAAIFRTLMTSAAATQVVKNVTVIGSGLMGSGIAQVAAQTGHNVVLVDMNNELLSKAEDAIRKSLPRVAKKKFGSDKAAASNFVNDSLQRLTMSTDASASVVSADLVVEAIIEDIEIKQNLFAQLDKVAPDQTIFTSNTSSLLISEISALVNRKDRFGGLHFFNPVPVMKLLEVVRTDETSQATVDAMIAWGKAIEKTTVLCKDTPGFIVNRLNLPYRIEAYKMLERGDAEVTNIALAMKYGAGYPMGPFELVDYTGLDNALSVMEGWEKKFPGQEEFKTPELLKKMVQEGKFGKKSGEGFYKY